MSALKAYASHIASAMDILAEARGMSERALIELGLPDVEARDLRALAAVYFGPTRFSRKQRHATTAARHHDLITLKLIEKYVSRVRTQRDAWNLQVELCRLRGPASEIARRAKQRLRDLRPRRTPPREGVQLLRRPNGPWTMRITAPSAFLAEFDAALDPARVAALLDRLPPVPEEPPGPAGPTAGAAGGDDADDGGPAVLLEHATWAAVVLDPEAQDEAAARADRLRAALAAGDPGPRVPVHGDLHPGNLHVDAAGERITGVLDADGVALAAIQGLNAKLERENADLRATLATLAARLAALEPKSSASTNFATAP